MDDDRADLVTNSTGRYKMSSNNNGQISGAKTEAIGSRNNPVLTYDGTYAPESSLISSTDRSNIRKLAGSCVLASDNTGSEMGKG